MQRILVIGNNTLIGAGVEKLLQRERLYDVYGIVAESSTSLLLTIKQIRPRVIIIDRWASSTIGADQLWRLLPHSDALELIEVSAGTPYIRIFTKDRIWLTRTADLNNVICRSANLISS